MTSSGRRQLGAISSEASSMLGGSLIMPSDQSVLMQVVRRIEVAVRDVKWAEAGELVAIISEASFYVLRFDRDAVEAAQGQSLPEDGLEEAFDLLHEVPETVRTGGHPAHLS